ncbi:DMT family transporter [Vallitalea okinawensis]|uniref:DMT family transporter n=1 Tax=Vallitalea okinawensis TaxID=2078660 RepID=UPI000CFD4CC1|nr:EamA family transporter [Vallitalea okinawensis]
MNKQRQKAILYLIIASLLWSIGGLFIKIIDWNPMAIAGARSGIASIVMLVFLKKPLWHIKLGKTKFLGALTYTSLLIFFVTANKFTTAANAILLQFTSPVWVALFSSWFLKEKVKSYDWLAIIAFISGMVLFFIGDLNSGNLFGNLIGLLSGVSMAGVVIFLKLQNEGSPVEMTLVGNIMMLIIGLPFFFISTPSFESILALLILGIFQLGISYIFYTLSIKYVSPVEAILIPVLEPLLNPIWVFLATGESPGIYAFIGGFIVILTVIIRGIYQQRKETSTY